MRLAYLGKILAIEPIENADRIVSAEVVCGEGGRWKGVIGKGQFEVGDRCTVYLQDAILKPSPELAFMERCNWRVRVQRFRGAPSECVITAPTDGYSIGDDLTEVLGVTKYVKKLHPSLEGVARGAFPSFIPKTDEPNFQTAYRYVEALKGQKWYATVKCDGSSTTAYRVDDHFGVCSRSLEKVESDCAFWTVARKYGLREKLPNWLALQWETCGPKIQANPLGLSETDGFAFQAWHIKEQRYLNRDEFVALCDEIGFPQAPLVHEGESFDLDADQLRSLAEGLYPNGKQREGIVVRPFQEQRVGQGRLSFKVLNLAYGEHE